MNKIEKQIDFFIAYLLKTKQLENVNFIKNNKDKIIYFFTNELKKIDINNYFINFKITKNWLWLFLTNYQTKEKLYCCIKLNQIKNITIKDLATPKQIEQLTTLLNLKSKYWYLSIAKIGNLSIDLTNINQITKIEAQAIIFALYDKKLNWELHLNKPFFNKWIKNNEIL